jgi:hypothetical protein
MKTIWMLAAAAALAACAGRGEDDMGAAPDRGDTTAVTTGADTTQFDTTTGGVGQTAEPGMLPDTTTGDVQDYPTTPSDTTLQDPGMTPDTTGGVGETAEPGMLPDTTAVEEAYPTDTAGTTGYDTTGATGYDTTGTGMSQDSAWVDPSAGATDTTQSAQ